MPRNVIRPRPEEIPSLFIGGIGQQFQKDSESVISQLTELCEEVSGPGSVRKVTLKNGYSFVDFTADGFAVKVAEKLHKTQFMKRWIVAQVQTIENHRIRQQERRKERVQAKRTPAGTSTSATTASSSISGNSGSSKSGNVTVSETSGDSTSPDLTPDLPVATAVPCALPVAKILDEEPVQAAMAPVQAVLPQTAQGLNFQQLQQQQQALNAAMYGTQAPFMMSYGQNGQPYFMPMPQAPFMSMAGMAGMA
eukprot:Hpha_TRINITY_DN16033_c0_g13::TRINITY_DN16033_c0_g13_i1::g.121724::m.121724